MRDKGSIKITVKSDNKINRTYQGFFSGIKGTNTFSNTGMAIENSIYPRFKWISDRIRTANCKVDQKHHLKIIVAYAPILIVSEKNSKDFYRNLD